MSKYVHSIVLKDKGSAALNKLSGGVNSLTGGLKSTLLPLAGVTTAAFLLKDALTAIGSAGFGFGQQMSKVKGLTNATEKEFQQLKDTARQLGSDTAFTAKQAAEGMGFLGMAGFTTNQILAAIPATLSLAAAGAIELGQAADIASNVLSQFQLPAEQTTRVADVMAKTITTSNTNMVEMAEGLKYLGPTAASLNIELEETASVIGVLANNGLKGSLGSRALSSSLTRLSRPTSIMKKSMRDLNVSFFDAKGEFIGIAGVIEELEGAFDGLTTKQKASNLSALFGAESFQEMSILMSTGSQKIREYTDDLILSKGVADKIAETNLDNVIGNWTKFKSALSEVAIKIATALKPAVGGLIQALTSGVRWVNEYAGALKVAGIGLALFVALQKSTVVWAALERGGRLALTLVTKGLTVSQWGLNTAMLANPLGIALAAAAALTVGYVLLEKRINRLTALQQATKELHEEITEATIKERAELEYLIDVMSDEGNSLKLRSTAYEKLKRLYPDILSNYDDEASALKNIDEIQRNITKNIEDRARKEAAAKLFKQTFVDELNLKEKINKENKKITWHGGLFSGLGGLKTEMSDLLKKREEWSKLMGKNGSLSEADKQSADFIVQEQSESQSVENIITGGRKQIITTINIDKVIENIVQNVGATQEAADEVVDKVIEGITRQVQGTVRAIGQ